jgi:hypothetical protein
VPGDRHPARTRIVAAALVVAALLAAIPGSHLLELWLSRVPAIVVSHGLGLALLALAVQQWRARGRGPTPAGGSAPR